MSRELYKKMYIKCEACNGTQQQVCVGYEINGMKYPAIASECPCCDDGYTPTYVRAIGHIACEEVSDD